MTENKTPPAEPEKCPVCVYGEPTDHTCDRLQQHMHRIEKRGRS